MAADNTVDAGMRYTAAGIAGLLGLPFFTVQRAARLGKLSSEFHASKNECDPQNPCHLLPDTQGQHYSIDLETAREWAAHRLERNK